MGFEFGRATTAEEIEAVQRLRYTVYVEELGRYQGVAIPRVAASPSPKTSTAGSSTRARATASWPRIG